MERCCGELDWMNEMPARSSDACGSFIDQSRHADNRISNGVVRAEFPLCIGGGLNYSFGMAVDLPTRPSLLQRLRDPEDVDAWSNFVSLYTPLIFGFCRGRGLTEEDAADVTQETLRAVAGSIGRFDYDPRRSSFRNWLFTVVRSKLNNFLAGQARKPPLAG
jgi:hypothetical protein